MKKLPFLVIIIFSSLLSYAQDAPEKEFSDYLTLILSQRKEKDSEFQTESKSPIPEEERKDFKGLNYYPPNSGYKVEAILERFDNPFHFKMKTTTDRLPDYALFGKITFTLQGQQLQLNVYQNVELLKKPGFEDYLFIPFNDSTNGDETYGGGRFLDARIPEGNILVVDFNKAYNPYCAYNHKYSCPIPPKENTLSVKLEAGEKQWHK